MKMFSIYHIVRRKCLEFIILLDENVLNSLKKSYFQPLFDCSPQKPDITPPILYHILMY